MELNATVSQFSTKFSRAETFAINQIRWRRNGSNHRLSLRTGHCLVSSRNEEQSAMEEWDYRKHGINAVSFSPTIIQTRVEIDHKARVSEFILDKLEGFFALHWSIFSLESFESKGSFLLQKYKHQLLRSLFQPTHGKKIFCMRTMPTFTSVKGGQNKSLSHEISFINNNNKYL